MTPIEKACEFLIKKSYPKYDPKACGKCATMVRMAFDFGFDKNIQRQISAKNYGVSYEKIGFKKVFSYPAQKKQEYVPQNGDICILQYEPHGHICVKTEKGWISDFKQIDMYGGKIREKDPAFDIYRF